LSLLSVAKERNGQRTCAREGKERSIFPSLVCKKRENSDELSLLVFANREERAMERWGAGVETQKNVRGEIGGWGRVPFHENYAPSLSTIYDGA